MKLILRLESSFAEEKALSTFYNLIVFHIVSRKCGAILLWEIKAANDAERAWQMGRGKEIHEEWEQQICSDRLLSR